MQFSWLKKHQGLLLAGVLAGLGTALLKGNWLVAVVLASVAALVAAPLFSARRPYGQQGNEQNEGSTSGPFTFNYRWSQNDQPDLAQISEALSAHGLKVDSPPASGSTLCFEGGSQFRSRLLGGYFVNPRYLPIRGELKTRRLLSRSGCELELYIRDAVGIGLRDAALEKRYALAAAEIEGVVKARVGEIGDTSNRNA